MLEAQERVVFVNAAPPSHGKQAALTFTPSDVSSEQVKVRTLPDRGCLWGEVSLS